MHINNLTPEQIALQDAARKLAQEVFKETAGRWDAEGTYPEENHKRLSDLGYLGMTIPEEYGGDGASLVDVYLVIEEIAKVDMNTALIVHDQNVSPRIIATCGSDELKQAFLPRFARGEIECSIAWTEPQAGSDATAVTTSVRPTDGGYVLNGGKIFTTFGDRADYLLVYARFCDSKGARGIGTILVKRDSPGVTIHILEQKMGARGCNECEIHFDDVFVPADHVVTEGVADNSSGFVKPIGVYNATRTGMGVLALGVAEGAFDEARNYMKTRSQFGKTLSEMQGLQWMMADMRIQIEAARAMCYNALQMIDNGRPDPVLCSIAKLQATEMAQKVTHDAMQMFGGYGYFGSLPLERMVRDVRMLTITGGTTQIHKNSIAAAIFRD
ncbi:MAG: acyl-CoA dehydrogenase family protein [Rhodobacteraceae bacterium]|nr:acyl-CoA dehydrogenase family protein [Paracoccaceae bacterium]